MPVIVEDLRQKKAEDPGQYQADAQALFALSKILFRASLNLNRGDGKTGRKIGEKLESCSRAIEDISKDPFDRDHRESIDTAMDALVELGDFLGEPAEKTPDMDDLDEAELKKQGVRNVCAFIMNRLSEDDEREMKTGLETLDRFCGLGMDVERLTDGEVIRPAQARRGELDAWRERRKQAARETAEQERRIAEEQERRKRREDAVRKNTGENRKQERPRQEARETGEQRQDAAEKERTRQNKLRAELNAGIENALNMARDPKASAREKMMNLAQAVACRRELNNGDSIDVERLNRGMQAIHDSAEFLLAEREGRLDELAEQPVEEIERRVTRREEDVRRCPGGLDGTDARASRIFRQLDRTWRVQGDSAQYKAAKREIGNLAGLGRPAGQQENYLAQEPVKQYVEKNLNAATSAVGKTRMACSLAFLKQIMAADAFRAYCANLNVLRRIPGEPGENGALAFDKTNPRCIEPDEIGTVSEVYQTAMERIQACARQNKMPPERDIAMLTALRSMEAKSGDGGDLVVEHETLQAEIERVRKDRRFQDAVHGKTAFELFEMARGGNIDTLEGYTKPLRPDQRERVERENRRIAEEEAAARERREREERDRVAREEKEAREREFRKQNKPISECFEQLADDLKEFGSRFGNIFALLDEVPQEQKDAKTFATLVALGEARAAHERKAAEGGEPDGGREATVNLSELNKRVRELEQDAFIRGMAKRLKQSEDFGKLVQTYTRQGGENPGLDERGRKIYPAVQVSKKLTESYAEYTGARERLEKKEPQKVTVAQGYGALKPHIDKLIRENMDYRWTADLAAKTLALREQERKGGGVDTAVDGDKLRERLAELRNDGTALALGRSLTEPAGREQLKGILSKPDREHAFAELVGDMQRQRLEKQSQQPRREGPEKQPEKGPRQAF